MRLDKWFYTNQDENYEKHAAQRLVSSILGYPPDVYERKPVMIQNVDIPSYDDLISMVSDAGFPEWEDVFRGWGEKYATRLAVQWSRLNYLREISEGTDNTYLGTDIQYPMVSYDYLQHLLTDIPDDIYAVNFTYRISDDFASLCEPVAVINDYRILSGYVAPVFYYLFTPAGAGWFLDTWRHMPELDFREVVFKAYLASPDGFALHKWYVIQPTVVHQAQTILDSDSDTVLSCRDHN